MTRVAVALALALSGCASLAEGTVDQSREVLLTSEPSGARVTQNGIAVCLTPCTVRQQRLALADPMVFAFPDGRRTELQPNLNWSPNALGNAALGGPVGLAVDLLSGRVIVADRHIHVIADAE